MENEMNEELNPSKLGTLEYWEKAYEDEINNFENHGDVGEIWFGRKNAQKMIKCIDEDLGLPKSAKIVDVGCGNGWTLLQLIKKSFTNLVGVDYSPKAVDLAKAILKENEVDFSKIQLMVCDILAEEKTANPLENDFDLVHDKGTYDAISLCPENPQEKRTQYIENVNKILVPSGYLVLSSCNWTEEELMKHFKDHFEVFQTVDAPVMSFGGRVGQSVTNVIFKKKQKKNGQLKEVS